MRSLQLFWGAWLAGAGYAEHTFEGAPLDEETRRKLALVPGMTLRWRVLNRRRHPPAARPAAWGEAWTLW